MCPLWRPPEARTIGALIVPTTVLFKSASRQLGQISVLKKAVCQRISPPSRAPCAHHPSTHLPPPRVWTLPSRPCSLPHFAGKSRRTRAYPQQVAATRPLHCLQDPDAHQSRLQGIRTRAAKLQSARHRRLASETTESQPDGAQG